MPLVLCVCPTSHTGKFHVSHLAQPRAAGDRFQQLYRTTVPVVHGGAGLQAYELRRHKQWLPRYAAHSVTLSRLTLPHLGSFPLQLLNCTKLNVLRLAGSDFQGGGIPTQIGLFTDLDGFYIENSLNLVSTLPTELGLITGLQWLRFTNNTGLTGSIPTELGTRSTPRDAI